MTSPHDSQKRIVAGDHSGDWCMYLCEANEELGAVQESCNWPGHTDAYWDGRVLQSCRLWNGPLLVDTLLPIRGAGMILAKARSAAR